ncbi:MAG: InlB B-repeat-containing protein, partial [Clostridia bacterium]|nr:InlB B-repeat-containing protein [Clostridia bacterium]
DAREAIRTGDPVIAQRALEEYAEALEMAADYLKASGLEKLLEPAGTDTDSLNGYLANYRDPTLYETYDEGQLDALGDSLFDAFFACAYRIGLQILTDYQEYLDARPSLSDEEAELRELLSSYSFRPLTEAEDVIYEELIPFFFCWQPSAEVEKASVTFPGGTWQIEGNPPYIRYQKYVVLQAKVSSLFERIDALVSAEERIEGYDPLILSFLSSLQDELADLLEDIALTCLAVNRYYSGETDALEYEMDLVEERIDDLGALFGDPSSAARDIDIIIACLNAASQDAQTAVKKNNIRAMARAMLEYADVFEKFADYFDAFGIISAYALISEHEEDYADLSEIQGLDENGILTAANELKNIYYYYYNWLQFFFKAIDQRDYLLTLEELTDQQDQNVRDAERFLFHYIPALGTTVLGEALPEFLPSFVLKQNKRAAVILDPNGGTGDTKAIFIRQDTETPLPVAGLTREAYDFAGWNTEPDGTGDFSFEDQDNVRISSDLHLYAQWDPLPATAPTITKDPSNVSLTYGYNSENILSVTATAADGHTVSAYQWYSGMPGDAESQAIEGAEEANYTVPSGLGAGTYDYYCIVTATRTDNLETASATSCKATVTVSPATPDYTVPEGLKATYGQTLEEVTLPDGWAWDDPLTTAVGNRGSNPFSATFTPEDKDNYTTVTETLMIEVAKALPEAASLPDEEKPGISLALVEETGEQPLVAAPSKLPEGYLSVQYSTDGGENWSEEIPQCTATGEYPILIRYCGDDNHEDLLFGPVIITVVKPDYTFVSDTDEELTFTRDSDTGLTVTVKLTGALDTSFAHFSGVRIGNVELKKDVDYTVTEGSTIVTILPEALNGLHWGKHTLTILFTNGEIQTEFTVCPSQAEIMSPLTGDSSQLELWIILMVVCTVAITAVILSGKKQKRSQR